MLRVILPDEPDLEGNISELGGKYIASISGFPFQILSRSFGEKQLWRKTVFFSKAARQNPKRKA